MTAIYHFYSTDNMLGSEGAMADFSFLSSWKMAPGVLRSWHLIVSNAHLLWMSEWIDKFEVSEPQSCKDQRQIVLGRKLGKDDSWAGLWFVFLV